MIRITTILLLLSLATGSALAGGFQATPGGALYKDLRPGAGRTAQSGDIVTIHFINWLEQDGERGRQIYDTRKHDTTVSFKVGTTRVIRGWNEAVTGMRAGGKRLVRLPPELGFGAKGVQDVIPGDARLVFLIELLRIETRE